MKRAFKRNHCTSETRVYLTFLLLLLSILNSNSFKLLLHLKFLTWLDRRWLKQVYSRLANKLKEFLQILQMLEMMMAEVAGHKRGRFEDYLYAGSGSDANGSSCSTRSVASFGVSGSKRASGKSPKEKKDRFTERVTALQQLVCPYGKTDTASVLQEASGYIRFLHDQLQVLSAPYNRGPTSGNAQEAEQYNSLKSRGLSLMPIVSTLQIARSNGADIWAPRSVSKHQ